MVKVIQAETKHNCEHLLGKFLDENHYDLLVDEDTDFYGPRTLTEDGINENNILFKFRKNVFNDDEIDGAYEGLHHIAGSKNSPASQNRGVAAGERKTKSTGREWVTKFQTDFFEEMLNPTYRIDGKDQLEELLSERFSSKYMREVEGDMEPIVKGGNVWLRGKLKEYGVEGDNWFDRFAEDMVKEKDPKERRRLSEKYWECKSVTSYANPVHSGVVGAFDRYPRIPYGRMTVGTGNKELYYLYLNHLDKEFKRLLPERYANQKRAADAVDPRFLIDGTVFSTLTVNRSFRTAAHRDAGDLAEGFSNLGVVIPKGAKGFTGGFLVLPEYRVAINIRPGDLLLIANHDAIHGNTPIEPIDPTDDPWEDCIRLSIVAYFREGIRNLGSWEYEKARENFINRRRTDKSHPLWRIRWNGVSPGCFESDEWYDFLKNQPNGEKMLDEYHPGWNDKNLSMENFFE